VRIRTGRDADRGPIAERGCALCAFALRSLGRVTAVTAVSLYVPAEFHVLLAAAKDVDARDKRDKRGHDDST